MQAGWAALGTHSTVKLAELGVAGADDQALVEAEGGLGVGQVFAGGGAFVGADVAAQVGRRDAGAFDVDVLAHLRAAASPRSYSPASILTSQRKLDDGSGLRLCEGLAQGLAAGGGVAGHRRDHRGGVVAALDDPRNIVLQRGILRQGERRREHAWRL